MQYVGQTCRTLQKRFGEHYDRRIRKPKNNDTFLYQHFERTGHSPNIVIVQPVEKIPHDKNLSVRFKNIKNLSILTWVGGVCKTEVYCFLESDNQNDDAVYLLLIDVTDTRIDFIYLLVPFYIVIIFKF